jgi:hypothetical protein
VNVFTSSNINDDNWLRQMTRNGNRAVFFLRGIILRLCATSRRNGYRAGVLTRNLFLPRSAAVPLQFHGQTPFRATVDAQQAHHHPSPIDQRARTAKPQLLT